MSGYPGSRVSRGTGGKQGISMNKLPDNQVTFESTEPVWDDSIPEVMLTQLPDVNDDLLLPYLTTPEGPVDNRERYVSPLIAPPLLEIPLLNGKVTKCQFVVTEVNTLKDISLRMTKYSKSLKSFEVEMTNWYAQSNTYGLRMMDIYTNGYYAAEMLLPNADRFIWARVQVNDNILVDSEVRKIKVAAVDYGIEDEVKLHHLSILRPQFREILPRLGLKAKLKLCTSKRKIPIDLFYRKLKKHLPGKTVEVYYGMLMDEQGGEPFTKFEGILFLTNGTTVQADTTMRFLKGGNKLRDWSILFQINTLTNRMNDR